MKESKHIVIVGGGFGGMNVARSLGNQKGLKVTLIDRRNHHLFQPLLYQVAIAALSPADIASPIRSILSPYQNIEVVLGEVSGFDSVAKFIHTEHGPIAYDYLILACGSQHSYFGHEDWESRAPGLKSIEEATEIRRRVLMAFEMAELEKDPKRQDELLSFAIIGGGPTGVELAGAIGEIAHVTLSKDFRHIEANQAKVILVEGGPQILSTFHPSLSEKAKRSLEKLGVSVYTNRKVSEVNSRGIALGDEFIPAHTVIWAAGVGPGDLNAKLGLALAKNGKVIIEEDLSIKGNPSVFVIGDQAHFVKSSGQALPALAPVAIQMGRHVAKNIIRERNGKKGLNFSYRDKGSMATIGRAAAVLEVGRIRMSGIGAWLAWLFVHMLYLLGFRNRWSVFMQWCWSYLTLSRGARLITSRNWKSQKCYALTKRYLEVFDDAQVPKPKEPESQQKG